LGKIANLFREILKEIGENPNREGLKDTPDRIEKMYSEVFASMGAKEPNITVFNNDEGYKDMVIVKDISFVSFCEHHFVPFVGKAHVGYLPTDKYIGLSKIARVIDFFCKKPQVQERLNMEIADYLYEKVGPKGLMVILEAEHHCMTIRGVKKPGSVTTTSAIRGKFDKNEFINLIRLGIEQ